MKVHFRKHRGNWSRPLLCVTHTERPMDLKQCSREYFITQFGAASRLPPKVPFEALTHAREFSPWKGSVTVWGLCDDGRQLPELLAYFEPTAYKPQQVLWYRERLWLLGLEQLEVFDSELRLIRRLEDPWLSVEHTVFPDERGRLVASCSASDAILFIDPHTYTVMDFARVPESIYGHNYHLKREDSVVEHYLHNDLQLAHLNCAWPWRGGVLITTLIQGAIGWFDSDKHYHELLRGYVGCHGIRTNQEGNLYFCDSCAGTVVVLSPELKVLQEYPTGSKWLHDAQQITRELYALAVSDRNVLAFVEPHTSRPVFGLDGRNFGEGVQSVSYGR